MADDLTIRPMRGTADDFARLKQCFDTNGYPRALDLVEWQYATPFSAEPLADFAIDGGSGDLAGIYAVAPVPFVIGGREVMGAQSLDTITDTRHQGKGVFKKLAKRIYARAAEEGLALVYGFPNNKSGPGLFKRLAWTEIAPVPFKIVPLRLRYILERVPVLKRFADRLPDLPLRRARRAPQLPEGTLREITRFDGHADRLWAAFSADIGVAVRRSAEYLTWRFVDKPIEEGYRMTGFWEGDAMRGYIVYTVKEKHGGRIGYVMEVIYEPGREDVGHALLSTALDAMMAARADAVLAWNFDHSANSAVYRRSGFFAFPERLRPIELHFGALTLDPAQADTIAEASNWYLSYCDSDTV